MAHGEPDFQGRTNALVDLWYVKGNLLLNPTIANAIPMSIENPALAYDSVNDRFKVDIAAQSLTTSNVTVVGDTVGLAKETSLQKLVNALVSVATDYLRIRTREDIVSLGGQVSPNAAGVEIVAPVGGQRIKVYDCGYYGGVDGYHYFYFGTSTSPTTKRFASMYKAGVVHKTFVAPRVSDLGDGLYMYASVSETNMPYDVGYKQE